MASRFRRTDWEVALGRWRDAGLVGEETVAEIRAWEAERESGAASGRLVDALSYLGVSIAFVAAVMLIVLAEDGGDAWLIVPFVEGVVAIVLAQLASRSGPRALADGFAASGVVLITVGVGFTLNEFGDSSQESIGWLLVCLSASVVGALMVRQFRSRLSLFLVAAALTAMPLAIAVEGNALEVGVFESSNYPSQPERLSEWLFWITFAVVIVMECVVLYALPRLGRFVDPEAASFGRLGASLGFAVAMLILASASSEPVIDWMVLLVGWGMTAAAFRLRQVELLPASAILLLGSLAGGLSDLDSGWGLGLTILQLLLMLQLTTLGLAGPRLLGRLGEHWLTPLWQASLLLGGVVAAAVLAADHEVLSMIGIVWSLALVCFGVLRRQRLELFFGVVGVYATGLTLVLGQLESSLGAVFGTLAFGLVLVVGAIWWRRRELAQQDAPSD